MDLIEPQWVYEKRRGSFYASRAPALPQARPPAPHVHQDDYWTARVLYEVREYGDEPLRITRLVNTVARLGNYSRSADYDGKRLELFKLVSLLIKTDRLDRVARNFVKLPRTDERYKAWLASVVVTGCQLPVPDV